MGRRVWTKELEDLLIALKKLKKSDREIGAVLGFTAHAIRDKSIKLEDAATRVRNEKPWSIHEILDLKAGVKNTEFLDKWQRGQWETNQKRFDVNNPKGRLHNFYSKMPHSAYPLSKEAAQKVLEHLKNNPNDLFSPIPTEKPAVLKPFLSSPTAHLTMDKSGIQVFDEKELLEDKKLLGLKIYETGMEVKKNGVIAKKNLREVVEMMNRMRNNIPMQRSTNVSTYQYNLIRTYCGEPASTNGIKMFGSRIEEKAVVDAAFTFLSALVK